MVKCSKRGKPVDHTEEYAIGQGSFTEEREKIEESGVSDSYDILKNKKYQVMYLRYLHYLDISPNGTNQMVKDYWASELRSSERNNPLNTKTKIIDVKPKKEVNLR